MTNKTPITPAQAGFSLVEILIVIVITTVGFLTLINLQIGTLRGVGTSKSMMQAINLSEHFIETLKTEALVWTGDPAVLHQNAIMFPYLRATPLNTESGQTSDWVKAYDSSKTDRRVGPLGNTTAASPFLLNDGGILLEVPPERDKKFCLAYRLTWIVPGYLMRADVRAMWLRNEADFSLYQTCDPGARPWEDLSNVSSITVPGTIMRNVFVQ